MTKTYKGIIALSDGKQLSITHAIANVSPDHPIAKATKHFNREVIGKGGGLKGASLVSLTEVDPSTVTPPEGDSPVAQIAKEALSPTPPATPAAVDHA